MSTFVKITPSEANAIGSFSCSSVERCDAHSGLLNDGNYAINVMDVPKILAAKGIDLSAKTQYTYEELAAIIPAETNF